VNRIDEIVIFHALDEANIASIARVQLRELERRVRAMDMDIEVSVRRGANWPKRASTRSTARGRSSARSSSSLRIRCRRQSWRAVLADRINSC
jgi:hypothetical protein